MRLRLLCSAAAVVFALALVDQYDIASTLADRVQNHVLPFVGLALDAPT